MEPGFRSAPAKITREVQAALPTSAEIDGPVEGLEKARLVVRWPDDAISVELPNTVDREIAYTEPAVKGDTSGKVMKPAKLANVFEVQVPLFVTTGDKIEIDTRTGEYKRRV